MYASLGNIIFEALKGFDTLSDTQTATFVPHRLIENKPRLQGLGEELQEFSIGGKFHVAFCDPETEFDALNEARRNKTILPLVYGNGNYENDFVITELKRDVAQTDERGNYVLIQWSCTLLEFYDPNKLRTQQSRAKLTAFAIDTDRPLPIGTPKLDDTLSAQLYSVNQQVRNQVFQMTQKINKVEGQINEYLNTPNAIIGMGQQFVNVANSLYNDIFPMAQKINANLGIMNTLLTNNTALYNINPALQPALTGASGVCITLENALGQFIGLPPTITNSSQGQYAVDTFKAAQNANNNLQDSMNDIFSNFGLFALFIAARKIRL